MEWRPILALVRFESSVFLNIGNVQTLQEGRSALLPSRRLLATAPAECVS